MTFFERAARGARTTAAATALLLVVVPAAEAGWSKPQPIRSPVRSSQPLERPAVALGTASRGSILAQRTTPEGALVVAQGSVRRARVGRVVDVLPGEALAYGPSPAGAAAVAIRSPAGVTGHLRDARAGFGAPIALGPFSTQVRVAVNARGDAVLATGGTGPADAISIVIRPARGAPSPPVAIGDGGAVGLFDVAIGARGHVAVAWSRGGILEARVLDPNGNLSPIARLTPPGTQISDAEIAVDSGGITDLAAIVAAPAAPNTSAAAAVVASRRPAGGEFSPLAVLDGGPAIESLEAVAAGRHGLVTWLRSAKGPPPGLVPIVRIHAAARRGGGPLRRVTVQPARGGSATPSTPRSAVAPDGGAVIVSGFGGSVHVARRKPGRSIFARPRAISTLAGGTPALTAHEPTVAAASGERALVVWTDRESLSRAWVLLPGTRDHSERERRGAPRVRSTPPVLDLGTRPATVRGTVSCDRPCRVTIRVAVSGGSSLTVAVRRVLPRGGRVNIAQQINPNVDRRLRRIAIRGVRTSVIAATRYGATVGFVREPRR